MTASAESDIISEFSGLSLSLPRVDDSRDNLPDSDHKAMDQAILKTFRSDILLKTPPLLDSLLFVITNGDKRLKSFSNDETEALLSKHPDLAKVLQRSWDAQSFREVRQLDILWPPDPNARKVDTNIDALRLVSARAETEATESSWMCPYVGGAANALWRHVEQHHQSHSGTYAHYTSMVQSSGMGKSRTVDEIAKKHFVIPINLRDPNEQGYPASDVQVWKFFTRKDSQRDALLGAHAFLMSLFIETKKVVDESCKGVTKEEIAAKFRNYMTDGQQWRVHNKNRVKFYETICKRASQMLDVRKKTEEHDPNLQGEVEMLEFSDGGEQVTVKTALMNLIKSVDVDPRRRSERLTTLRGGDPIILAFDEAHALTGREKVENQNSLQQWSLFSEFRRALRDLNESPIFSLFLSTTGKVSQFSARKADDPSRRVQLGLASLIVPFTDLGFDQFAKPIKTDGSTLLDTIASDQHMVTLGRPLFASRYNHTEDRNVKKHIVLFAAEKLLNGRYVPQDCSGLNKNQRLACLSQRMPIEFFSITDAAQSAEDEQVTSHMRVCLKVLAGFQGMITTSPSEPILSEAASEIMSSEGFDAPRALQEVMSGFSIHKGDRGEFIVMLLLTLARDNAVKSSSRVIPVTGFLESLFRDNINVLSSRPSVQPKNQTQAPRLREALANAKLHFNHFIKVHQHSVIRRKYLAALISRGAAILCGNCQPGVDGVIPFVFEGDHLEADKIGVILWQSKLDKSYTNDPDYSLFDKMDPIRLKIFDGEESIPVIRIVFALAARTSSVQVLPENKERTSSCIAYDIWCSGASSDLAPVKQGAMDTWTSLVGESEGWRDIYKGETVELRKSMNPGVGEDNAFWEKWASLR